ESDDVNHPERFPYLDGLSMQFLNEANIATLMTPGFRYRCRIKSHSGQPGAGVPFYIDLIGTNHSFGDFVFLSLIEKSFVRSKVLKEFLGWNEAPVAQINLRKRVSLVMADMSRHVDAIKNIVDCVDAGYLLARQNISHSRLENEGLLPHRACFVAFAGFVEL